MNVTGVPLSIAVEKYKNEIMEFMIINPEKATKQGIPDSVDITDVGRMLSDLSRAGSTGSRELIANIMAGKQDDNLEHFLQAYCYVYGIDISGKIISYDKYGIGSRGSYYEALKKYLSTFTDYLLDETDEDDPASSFIKSLRKYLKKLAKYIRS